MITRRHLLRLLLATPLAATFDVEKLLWVPGQMVVVPPPHVIWNHRLWEIDHILKRVYFSHITEFLNTPDPLCGAIRAKG